MGRLPVKYTLWIVVAGVLTFALVGAWIGFVAEVTPPWPSMAVAGTLLGIVVVAVFLRVMGRSGSSPTAPRHGS